MPLFEHVKYIDHTINIDNYRTAPAKATIHDAIRAFRPNPAEKYWWNVEVIGGGGWGVMGFGTIFYGCYYSCQSSLLFLSFRLSLSNTTTFFSLLNVFPWYYIDQSLVQVLVVAMIIAFFVYIICLRPQMRILIYQIVPVLISFYICNLIRLISNTLLALERCFKSVTTVWVICSSGLCTLFHIVIYMSIHKHIQYIKCH